MEFIDRIIYALTELHPIHPMFVHFPIALTGAAFLFIVLAYWKNNASLESAAYANIALAAISTIVAGVTGFLDNLNTYEGEAPNGGVKIIVLAFREQLDTVGMYRGFRLLDQLFHRENHRHLRDAVVMPLQPLQFALHIRVQCGGDFQVMTADGELHAVLLLRGWDIIDGQG
jgi:hypothetical protein